jgi:alpha-L-fucosidase 2
MRAEPVQSKRTAISSSSAARAPSPYCSLHAPIIEVKDPEAECRRDIESAASRSFDELKMRHIAEHQSWFAARVLNCTMRLKTKPFALLPTNERLKRVREGASDAALASLYFDFGRYLLIASSRPGTLPANLQGIWNPLMDPPWASDFHTNINIQMNYWPSGVCNLSECQTALFDWMETLVAPGRETARVHYGCEGFVVHHVSDPWGWTVPGDIARTGVWPMGGAWLCDHVWEQWLFDGDETWLRVHGFPLLRENALFLLDFLIEDESGMLVSGPSSSPENTYFCATEPRALCAWRLQWIRRSFAKRLGTASKPLAS